jgi:hypothetical protein
LLDGPEKPVLGFVSGGEPSRISPQKRHFLAAALIVSAQEGQGLVSCSGAAAGASAFSLL